MEKRIGVIAVILYERESIPKMNRVLGDFHELILARQGLPLRDRSIHVISLIVEGSTDTLGALTGQLGKIQGIQVKSVLAKPQEASLARDPEQSEMHN